MHKNQDEIDSLGKSGVIGAITVRGNLGPEYEQLTREQSFLTKVLLSLPPMMKMAYTDNNSNIRHDKFIGSVMAIPVSDIRYPAPVENTELHFQYDVKMVRSFGERNLRLYAGAVAYSLWGAFVKANPQFEKHVTAVIWSNRLAPRKAVNKWLTFEDLIEEYHGDMNAEYLDIDLFKQYVMQAQNQRNAQIVGYQLKLDWYHEI